MAELWPRHKHCPSGHQYYRNGIGSQLTVNRQAGGRVAGLADGQIDIMKISHFTVLKNIVNAKFDYF